MNAGDIYLNELLKRHINMELSSSFQLKLEAKMTLYGTTLKRSICWKFGDPPEKLSDVHNMGVISEAREDKWVVDHYVDW